MQRHDPMARCGLLLLVVAIPLLIPGGAAAQGTAAGNRHMPIGIGGSNFANRSLQTVTGMIQQIDAAGVITIIDKWGKSLRLHQANNAVITLNGKIVSLKDVPVGILAVAIFEPGTGTFPAVLKGLNAVNVKLARSCPDTADDVG
jgi:hypothetical protein